MARSGLAWVLVGGAVLAALDSSRRRSPPPRPEPLPPPPPPPIPGLTSEPAPLASVEPAPAAPTPAPVVPPVPTAAPDGWRGPVVAIARPTFTSAFGARATPDDPSGHLGLDLGAPEGTPIRALAPGVVVGSYPDGAIAGYGNLVVIDHGDDTAGLYAHLQSIAEGITRGAHVMLGQLVGLVGRTNSSGGFRSSPPHLHLEVLHAAPGERARAFSRFRGGADHYPERDDPAAWAAARGIRLVGA